jgi:hypothetical protein
MAVDQPVEQAPPGGRLLLSWCRSSTANPATSFVDIRLRGDFGNSTVKLDHTGLCSVEYFWRMAMWRTSLKW